MRFLSIPALIAMQEVAGRPRDVDDIQHLRWILEEVEAMSQMPDDIDWSLTTWEGSRREQLRHALSLTLRQRLQAVEDMAEVAQRFQEMREAEEFSTARSAQLAPSASEAPAVHPRDCLRSRYRQNPHRYWRSADQSVESYRGGD